MQQEIHQSHYVEANGNPSGGLTSGIGFMINWQNGPLVWNGVRQDPNGAFVEGVIKAAVGRLEHYQESKFRCEENENALACLYEALRWLDRRTAAREARGVEGTHEA